MKSNCRGFTLLEVIASSIVLLVAIAGAGSFFATKTNILKTASHRVQALNLARQVANRLLPFTEEVVMRKYVTFGGNTTSSYYGPTELDTDFVHNIETDPDICALPSGFVTDTLGASVSYTVIQNALNSSTYNYGWSEVETVSGVLQINVTIIWNDPQTGAKSETITMFSSYYEQETEKELVNFGTGLPVASPV